MKISAGIENKYNHHEVSLTTNGQSKTLFISPKPGGFGSSVNGGELLFLALATCYCNDLYREAAKKNIVIQKVEVIAEGEFGGEGEAGRNIGYSVTIQSNAAPEEIKKLARETDAVAEIQNTLRQINNIVLRNITIS